MPGVREYIRAKILWVWHESPSAAQGTYYGDGLET